MFIHFVDLFKELAFSFINFPLVLLLSISLVSPLVPFFTLQLALALLYCFLSFFRRKLRLLTLDISSFVIDKCLML